MKAIKTGFFYALRIVSIFIIVFGIIGIGLSPGGGIISLSAGIILLVVSNTMLKKSGKNPNQDD